MKKMSTTRDEQKVSIDIEVSFFFIVFPKLIWTLIAELLDIETQVST